MHERQGMLETYIRTQLALMLRLEPTALDVHQPISTLGLDSLTTIELKNALEGSLGVAVPVSSFLQGASIAQLVSRVLHELAAPASAAHQDASSRDLDDNRLLSNDQVRRLLDLDKLSAGGTLS
jgi:acyl carrier protein